MNLAHGLGGAKDLPISPELTIAGAVAALVISFSVLALAWRHPRFDADRDGRALPGLQRIVDSVAFVWACRLLGLLLAAIYWGALVLGQDLLTNPAFGMFYVLMWVGLVPASLLLGPVWKAISPVRTLHAGLSRVCGVDPELGLADPPRWLGYWPAALALFSFVYLELISPSGTELGTIRLWSVLWLVLLSIGALVYGSRFLTFSDPFEVFSTFTAHVSIWGRRNGGLVVRNPLSNLAGLAPAPGLVAVVAVLFGSTGFDSFKESPRWLPVISQTSHPTLLNLAAMTGLILLVAVVLCGATMATGVGDDVPRRALPGLFAPTLVPIIVGYVIAHYTSYFFSVGQLTAIQMSDPLGTGANYLGTGDLTVSYWLSYHPTLLANIKVLAVVIGHVVAAISAHDRALRVLPRRHQLTGQLPLLFAMVGFTAGGLYLLFSA